MLCVASLGFTKFGDKCVNDFDLLQLKSMLTPGKSMQADLHVKLPVCPTPAGCICSNSGVTLEQFAQRTSETGEQSLAMGNILRTVAKMLASPVAPFKQC